MASRWQKTIQRASTLTGLVGGTFSLLTRQALPQKSGVLKLAGIHEGVEVVTDRYGIPHIYAHNQDDLYFAQGYLHAQDRLWQLDLNRRLVAGRLSEILGTTTLEIDRFCRRLGMRRAAVAHMAQIAPDTRRILDAYANGINSFIETHRSRLPIEFNLLNYQPEPWSPVDTVQWSKMQAWNLNGNWETEIIRARLVAKLGPERAAKLEAGYDPEHPLIVPPGVSYQGVNIGLLEQYQQIKDLSGFGAAGGSNNWVIDGTMSETGAPMLCNDPHLGHGMPSIWYECHLVAGELDVVGVSFPGSPGIIIGHNQHISWGVTNAVADVQDLYIEKFNPENPHQYEFQGEWQEAEVIQEEIFVKDQTAAIIEEVRVTRHGPIITAIARTEEQAELPLAIRWTALEQSGIVDAIQNINRATNWTEFLVALRDWDTPAQNFVYADRGGNIGYMMAGVIPIRAQGQALLPSPGWTGEYEWSGYIPFEELPQSYNPEQHFIVTANNRVVDDSYPYYITHEWSNGYRAQRIRDLLTSKEKLTLADMANIQMDQYALPALDIVKYMLELPADTPLKRAAQDILKAWDYILAPESIGAALYTTYLRKLEGIVLNTVLGDDETLMHHYRGATISIVGMLNNYVSRTKPLLLRLLQERDESWFDSSAIPNGPKTWESALLRAFEATLEELSHRLGHNILGWQYGALHKMSYKHPLGTIKVLEGIFNRGSFAVGGDNDTVNVAMTSPAQPEEVMVTASYRQIIDMGDFNNSLSIHAPGQSGQPGSAHFDDFIKLWQEGHYHPMLFDRKIIELDYAGKLALQPQDLKKLV